jgi:hypothetical protein
MDMTNLLITPLMLDARRDIVAIARARRARRQRRLFVVLLIIFAVALARFVHLTFP